MLNQTKRIVIIGGGPAGYEAALAGAKYGAEITIIEDQGMGGNSVILDCVPSKSFIAGANIKTDLRRAEDMKLNEGIGQADLSLTALNKRVQDLASNQSSDIRAKLQAAGVRHLAYYPDDFLRASPALAALVVVWSLSEIWGYLFGPGDALARIE